MKQLKHCLTFCGLYILIVFFFFFQFSVTFLSVYRKDSPLIKKLKIIGINRDSLHIPDCIVGQDTIRHKKESIFIPGQFTIVSAQST